MHIERVPAVLILPLIINRSANWFSASLHSKGNRQDVG